MAGGVDCAVTAVGGASGALLVTPTAYLQKCAKYCRNMWCLSRCTFAEIWDELHNYLYE